MKNEYEYTISHSEFWKYIVKFFLLPYLLLRNPNHQDHPKGFLGHTAWNKGLTKETDERVRKNSEAISEAYVDRDGTFKNKHHTEETKKYLSEKALADGREKNFGSHKSYEYCGIKFISSYEVEVAKDLDKNNIKWVKPSRLAYTDNNGKKHHYTADLYLPDYNIYLDPKNDYLIENINPTFGYSDVQKINWVMEQNGVVVIILNKDELNWNTIYNKIRRYNPNW